MKKMTSFMTLLLAVSFSAVVFAKDAPVSTTNVKTQLIELIAKVKSIDYNSRRVVLDGPEGPVAVKLGDEVKNFRQIKKGDDVVVKYKESLVWSIIKKDTKIEPASVTTSASTASPRDKPALDKSSTLDLIAVIKAIDKKVPTVTLQGPEGNTMTVKVQDPTKLEGVKVGDKVAITYTESLAVDVQAAPKK